jgi:hypothetical protein
LDLSRVIRDYFSKVEGAALKARLKEVRASEVYVSVKHMIDYLMAAVVAIV